MRVGIGLLFALLLAAPAQAIELAPGASEFWSPSAGRSCGERCWEFDIDVAPGGDRLRVGIERPRLGSVWDVSGGPDFDLEPGLYSAEGVEENPAPGRRTLRVTADSADTEGRFRMRAKLELPPVVPNPPVLELPNLQPLPPWDFSFMFPVSNGTTDPDTVGLPLPGGRVSCHPEEVIEEGAVRCLRMAYGVGNTGRGPMELFVGEGTEFTDRPLIQKVMLSDGTVGIEHDAGLARFHKTHQHYHHDKAIGLELFKVTAPGVLEDAGNPHMKGFAHRDELLRDWRHFYPRWQKDGFGLLAGWGDYYEWDRPGNYIDFGINGDGLYVVRITADPVGGVLESDEGDNVGYSLIEVAGETVTHLASGRGKDPWDRCRIELPLGPEPELPKGIAQNPRPADCPADTIDPDPAVPVAQPAAPTAAKPAAPAARKKAKPRKCKRRRGESRRAWAKRSRSKRCRAAARRYAAAKRRSRG